MIKTNHQADSSLHRALQQHSWKCQARTTAPPGLSSISEYEEGTSGIWGH